MGTISCLVASAHERIGFEHTGYLNGRPGSTAGSGSSVSIESLGYLPERHGAQTLLILDDWKDVGTIFS
jgi:hypothetical protein